MIRIIIFVTQLEIGTTLVCDKHKNNNILINFLCDTPNKNVCCRYKPPKTENVKVYHKYIKVQFYIQKYDILVKQFLFHCSTILLIGFFSYS